MSSTDIAGLTGGFNQQIMLQQQQSAMLTQQFGGYSPNPYNQPVASRGEQYGGALVNTMGHLGSAVSAGVSAFVPGGSAIMAPFDYAGGQAMHGIHQQQQLDMSLRQSYRFANQAGGRGFQGMETAAIGSNLRQMSHQRGPGGETASFEELGQLASNMGRMGMAEGVRSAKDFNEKFKQMLTTVKTIATELGTSLEEAQKVMASLKGSGIFHNQGKFAGSMRIGALGGNMSIAEMSSAAQMGSQISRSVGGLGKSGAQAGINTLSNIGAATQAGIMSEEDIYNATGLTGAEGRQAMAQNMMSQDAEFFSGGKGRRVLASIAGKNGTIDDKAVARYMAGGVSTGDTMNMAHEHLGKTGRANFIRNEGRLRGEGMRAFGGLGKAIAAKDWFESRGLELNGDNDRAMIGFQRIFNVGRDEADQMVKMASNLDTIMEHRQSAAEDDKYSRQRDQLNRKSSPEEIMKRFDRARTEVNDSLRQVGASFYKSISNTIDEYIGKISGEYIQERRASMSGIVSQMMRGGHGVDAMMSREFGRTRDSSGRVSGTGGLSGGAYQAQQARFGTGELSGAQFGRYVGGNAERFRENGWDISGATSMSDIQEVSRRAQGLAYGYGAGTGTKDYQMDAETREALSNKLSFKGIEGHGAQFTKNFIGTLKGLGTDQADHLAFAMQNRWDKSKTEEEQGQVMRDLIQQVNPELAELYTDRTQAPGMLGAQGSPYATVNARNIDIGKSFQDVKAWRVGQDPRHTEGDTVKRDWSKKLRGQYADSVAVNGGEGTFWGGTVGDTGRMHAGLADAAAWVTDTVWGDAAVDFDVQNATTGERVMSEEALKTTKALMHGTSGTRQALLQQLQERSAKLNHIEKEKRTPGEIAELKVGKAQTALGELASGKTREEVAQKLGYGTTKDMDKEVDELKGTAVGDENGQFLRAMGEMGERASGDALASQASEKEIDDDIASGRVKIGPAAVAYRAQVKELAALRRRGSATMTGEAANALWGEIRTKEEGVDAIFTGSSKTRAQREKDIEDIAKTDPRKAMQLKAALKDEDRLKNSGREESAGNEEAIAGILGAKADPGSYKGLTAAGSVQKTMDALGLGAGSNVDVAKRKEFEEKLLTITKGVEYGDDGSVHMLSDNEKAQRLGGLKGDARKALVEAEKKDKEEDYKKSEQSKQLTDIAVAVGKLGAAGSPLMVHVMNKDKDKDPPEPPHGNG
jgi:hypothetical protein